MGSSSGVSVFYWDFFLVQMMVMDKLDFLDNAFNGDARWLVNPWGEDERSVMKAGNGGEGKRPRNVSGPRMVEVQA